MDIHDYSKCFFTLIFLKEHEPHIKENKKKKMEKV